MTHPWPLHSYILELLKEHYFYVEEINVKIIHVPSNNSSIVGKSRRLDHESSSITSVTRSGDFLDFGQLFKAFGNN